MYSARSAEYENSNLEKKGGATDNGVVPNKFLKNKKQIKAQFGKNKFKTFVTKISKIKNKNSPIIQ